MILLVIPLSKINVGENASVVWIASEGAMAGRLCDLGFVPDEEISCVLKGAPGHMAAYLVRHAVIALRERNASEILVRVISD